MDQDAHMRRIIENLSSDLNNLSSESKRKFSSVKEVPFLEFLVSFLMRNILISLKIEGFRGMPP